jgi:hypothetical protein
VAVDEEQKLGDDAERPSASAFLARYKRFRYIETRSGMKMSHKTPPFAFSLAGTFFARGLDCRSPFLTGSAPQTEIDVTCSKQTTEKFLTGARTHIKETRICAKMNAQISSKLSAQMSQTR